MSKQHNPQEPFEGFDPPYYTQVPDAVFDRFLPELTGAELKVLLYICRRTFGFKKSDDDISISQLMHGITKRNGDRLDYGTGLSRDSVTRATKSLEDKGLIVRTRNSSDRRGDQPTTYRLKMRGEGVRLSDTGVPENRTGPVRESDPQETDIQDTEDNEIRIRLTAFISDFSREFRDRAQVSSSVTRTQNLLTESGMAFDDFIPLLYEARARTKKAINVRNRMSFFFAVLEDLVRNPTRQTER